MRTMKMFAAAAVLMGTLLGVSQTANALVINVTPWLAPNAFGDPNFATAEANAVQAMYQGLSSYGTPDTPGYFEADSYVTSAQAIVTGFNSWRGVVNPGSPYQLGLGNRMTFGVGITGSCQASDQFSISQMSMSMTSTDPFNALNFNNAAGVYNYGSGYMGVLCGTDGLLGTSDDQFVQSGLNTQLVNALFGRGSGNSFAAYCDGIYSACTLADQQASLNASAAYPGGPFDVTALYRIGDFSGSGTMHVNAEEPTTVPEPGSIALLSCGLVGLGFVRQRRRQLAA